MKNISIANQPRIKDPILVDFSNKATQVIMASINQRLLHEYKPDRYRYGVDSIKSPIRDKGSVKSTASVIMKYADQRKYSAISRRISRSLAPSRIRMGNTFAASAFDLKSGAHIYEQKDVIQKVFTTSMLGKIDKSYLLNLIESLTTSEQDGGNDIEVNTGVQLRLFEVKCIDDTSEWGKDEIAMGGTFIAPDGTTSKLNEFRVGNNFDDGRRVTYSPSKVLKTFNLNGSAYPQTFLANLVLSEKDNGGTSDFIQELYEATKDEVEVILAAMGALAGAYIGAQIGGAGGSIAGPLGTVIGIVAGMILGAVIGWLVSTLKDDIFPVLQTLITLPDETSTFGGSLNSGNKYLHYHDHGGHYRVKYRWVITR